MNDFDKEQPVSNHIMYTSSEGRVRRKLTGLFKKVIGGIEKVSGYIQKKYEGSMTQTKLFKE